jgi:hypothetical protein
VRSDSTLVCWGENDSGQVVFAPAVFLSVNGGYNSMRQASLNVALRWNVSALSSPTGYDVQYEDDGELRLWQENTTATEGTFPGTPGHTYCFAVRARFADGSISDWRYDACATIPLDDRVFARSSGWTSLADDRYYQATALRSSAFGSTLTLRNASGTALGLIATTCPTCGTIEVWLGGSSIGTFSLRSPTRVDRALVGLLYDDEGFGGTLRIKVISKGKPVVIDGIAVSTMGDYLT